MRAPSAVIGGLAAFLVVGSALVVPVPVAAEPPAADRPASAPPQLYVRSGDGVTILQPEFRSDRDDFSSGGLFGPDDPVTVANLTVSPGEYVIGYTFEVRMLSATPPEELRCGVADANGSGALLFEGDDPVTLRPGWQLAAHATRFGLPEMTLSVRCFPSTATLGVASFRSVEVTVTRLP